MWSSLPKTQKCVVTTIWYSACNNTPTAATAAVARQVEYRYTAVYRKGEYVNKKEYFCKLLAILHLSLELRWQGVGGKCL